ncbi:hypothetical protein TeGR_g822 [Tetraparma gracilis]|uniref:Uncharacterized protein n=1 Tax=Tetraparma gracilis TaxID=2962635 RepID=A0ABQ6MQT5_9STRA|nr:hypothetical protein TeGR_g822 [Tetraparma gracilis]
MPINAIKSVLKGGRSATKIGIDDGPKVHSGEELDAMLEDVRAVFAHAAQDLVVKLAEVDPNVLLARSVETGVADDDDLFGAGLAVCCSELDRKDKEEQEKKDKKLERMETKRKAVEGEELLKGIAAAGQKEKDEYNERQLDMDLNQFLDFGVTVAGGLAATVRHMFVMLMLVGLLAAVSWVLVWLTREVIVQGVSATNSTLEETTSGSGGEAEASEAGTEGTAVFLLVVAVMGSALVHVSGLKFLNAQHMKSYLLQLMIVPLSTLPVVAYYMLGGERTNGIVLGTVFIATSCFQVSTVSYAYFTEHEADDGNAPISAAGKRAKHLLEHGEEMRNMTHRQKLKFSILIALPNLFTYFVLMLLVVGIFALYDAYEHPGWKVAVTILALGIKVVGNKALLGLLGTLPMWLVDWELYMYEMGTALVLRILQLSIPDQNTAQLVCLFGAVAEVSVRVFFYVNFLKGGLRNKTMTMEQLKKYAKWGKIRVQDGSNDMVVEYMSSIIAGFFMIQLAPTGVFSFASETSVDSSTILTLMSYQLIPELFLDFFVTFTEVFGGLGKLHASYWSINTGSAPDSKYWAFRMGDLFKSVVGKVLFTWFLTAFVLLVVLRRN